MSAPAPEQPRDVTFGEVPRQASPVEQHLAIEDLRDVRLMLTGDLGRCTMTVRDVLELKRGSVITLDKLAGEMADICINGVPLARGEIVVIADGLHVRIADIIGAGEKDESGEEA
ncbi:MAG TPA: flagellar motor switch protein FliN [Candidatus Hydrogenedentes bacterium]|nr:flagellar motor switch protein FliN [Candidatus Hydrogenedentota bacterium]